MIEAAAEPVTASAASSSMVKSRSWPAWLPDVSGALACCAAALFALVPLAGPGMVATHDGLLHVQRLISLDIALHQGALLPRWLPDLAYGYGQPLLLYYAPLAYLPALTMRLLGGSYLGSFAVASGLPLILSGLAMYLLARSLFGVVASATAGIVYATLPYQLVDLYVRGALAESWAFVWLPLTTWCLVKARTDGQMRWSVGLALSLAGLIVTHNVTALLFAPALALLGLMLWISRTGRPRPRWSTPLAGFVLALGLSAWFWWPAIAERSLVQLGEIVEPDLFASFFFRGLPPFRLDLLFDYREPASTAMGYPIFWPQVGLVQAVLSMVGAVVALRARGHPRILLVWATLLVIGGIVLQAGPAARVFDLVPLLSFVQFPWRLLALVGLGSALLAGAMVECAVRRTSARAIIAGLVVAASLVTGLARLEPEHTSIDEQYLAADTALRAEIADYGLGTTHSGEYLPATSGQRNASRFRKALIDDPPSQGTTAPPSAIEISGLAWRANTISVNVNAAAPDRLVIHQFAFPGWAARIDGATVPTITAGPFGLLAVDVPAGVHTVDFAWEQTMLRGAAAGVSLLSLSVLVLMAIWTRRRAWGRQGRSVVVGVGVLGMGLIAWAGSPGTATSAADPTIGWQPIDDSIVLVGVQNDTSRLGQDRSITTQLTWFVRQAPTSGVRVRVEIAGADGSSHASQWPYEALSRHLQRGELIPTTIVTRLPDDFGGGPAAMTLRFDQPAGAVSVPLGDIPVWATSERARSSARDVPTMVTPWLSVTPTGIEPVRSWLGGIWQASAVRPGGTVDVGLRWQETVSAPDLAHEFVAVVALSAPGGDLTSEPARPGGWFNPLPFWQAGDIVDQHVRLILPATLAPGTYPMTARIYSRDLARGGMAAPGASNSKPRGRPVAEVPLGDLTVAR
jgi:hypothetical protein